MRGRIAKYFKQFTKAADFDQQRDTFSKEAYVWSDEFHGTVPATPAQQAEQHAITVQLFGSIHAIVAQARAREGTFPRFTLQDISCRLCINPVSISQIFSRFFSNFFQ